MLARVLETEVMDDPAESRAYDQMDHTAVNTKFVADLLASGLLNAGSLEAQADDCVVLDVGTGTAQIPVELCQRFDGCQIVACDAAISMLEIARINVAIGICEHRIQLYHRDAKQLEFLEDLFDGVMSNSLLHHLPEPVQGLSEMLRVCKPSGWLFIRDLMRPESSDEVERLVGTYAGNEPAGSQQLFRQSLHAALTVEETQGIAIELGLPAGCVQATSDRHWTLSAKKPRSANDDR